MNLQRSSIPKIMISGFNKSGYKIRKSNLVSIAEYLNSQNTENQKMLNEHLVAKEVIKPKGPLNFTAEFTNYYP